MEGSSDCEKVMHLIAGMRGATAGLMAEVVEDHVQRHLIDKAQPNSLNARGVEQLLEVVRAYLK